MDNELLNSTLNCLLNQTEGNFLIFVVYSEKPICLLKDAKINYIQSPFPFLDYEQIPNHEAELEWHKDKELMARRFDKSKKIIYGCKFAKERGCKYLMAVDADDLVSSKIVAFLNKNNEKGTCPGWYINKGYVLKKNHWFGVKNLNMHSFNGSTHILREDLVDIPDFYNSGYVAFSMFTAHGWTKNRIKDYYNEELNQLNFFGVIYIVHSGNLSRIASIYSEISIKNISKRIIRGKYINKKIRKEFGL